MGWEGEAHQLDRPKEVMKVAGYSGEEPSQGSSWLRWVTGGGSGQVGDYGLQELHQGD
jgi:hypothetical protein